MRGRLFRPFALVAFGLASAGCRDAGSPTLPAPGDSIWVTPSELSLAVGQATRLEAMLIRRDGHREAGARFRFSSDQPDVAAVDSAGRVTALAPGTAGVTASSGGLRNTVRVQVPWGDLSELRLDVPAGRNVVADLWSLSAAYIHFRAVSAVTGTSVCGKVPLSFALDTTVAVAMVSPLAGDPCMIRIVPRARGYTSLTVSGPGASASVGVEVTTNRYWLGLEREDGRQGLPIAGSLVRYRLTMLDENGRPALGLAVSFGKTWGTVTPESAVLDSAGKTSITWALSPYSTLAAFYAQAPDGSIAQVRQEVTFPTACSWRLERIGGSPDEPAYVGSTVRYRVTVLDGQGLPVPGLSVRFTTDVSNPIPPETRTDSAGRASVDWTLQQTGTARIRVQTLDGVVHAEAVQKTKPRFSGYLYREDGAAGEPALVGSTVRFRFVARDENNQGVPGVVVYFRGSGSTTPDQAVTDASGGVSVAWTLPTRISGVPVPPYSPPSPTPVPLSAWWYWPEGLGASVEAQQMVKFGPPGAFGLVTHLCFLVTVSPRYPPEWRCYYADAPSRPGVSGDTVYSKHYPVAADVVVTVTDRYGNVTQATPTVTADQPNTILPGSSTSTSPPATVVEGNYVSLAPGVGSQWVTVTYPGVPPRRVYVVLIP